MKKQNKVLNLITHPNPILRKVSVLIDIKKIDKKMQELVANMIQTMISDKGIGLAAPQIGKNIRLIIVNYRDKPFALINPVIVKFFGAKVSGEEGCLSIPHVFGDVLRYRNVDCEYFDLRGNKQCLNAKGLLARVIQHEIDHLDGILFIDKMIKDNSNIK
ncbi:peptide deformylase [Patescibacteria group bacterium]|nr:peptide deformylase [Patescibacteria group bacterium]